MRLTIERLRTLVLVVGIVLVASIALFLAVGRWRNGLKALDIPARLGINITQQANHVVYTQSHAGHTLFRIDASKVIQVKAGTATLSDATIDLYGADGSRVDQIKGKQFEYDSKAGIARAIGMVEITLMKPGVAPAIAPQATPNKILSSKNSSPLTDAAATAEQGNIHIKTSGLVFDQKSGIATTSERVEFSLTQGAGSAMGATFDSQQGQMVLDKAVELRIRHGAETVALRASHALFERGSNQCLLHSAIADLDKSQATASDATIFFREDGSVVQLNATGGFNLTTTAGGHLTAPRARLDFDAKNHPRAGHLEGGVGMDSSKDGRTLHGTAPAAELAFNPRGELRHAHLTRGVEFDTNEQQMQASTLVREHRRWQSPVTDLEFRTDAAVRTSPVRASSATKESQPPRSQLELASIHGTGGVVVTSESQYGSAPAESSRLAAGDVVGLFGADDQLRSMVGTEHGSIEETTAKGVRQLATGDRLEAIFVAPPAEGKQQTSAGTAAGVKNTPVNIKSATLTGHVVLVQTPATGAVEKNGAVGKNTPAPPLRATAGRVDYEGEGEWMHLTLSPRVQDSALQMTADRMDVSRASGDAFAHGNVKATWQDVNATGVSAGLGGAGPTHVISSEAELHQTNDEAIFRGQARMWQGANSIAAPVITLNRKLQTLVAEGAPPQGKAYKDQPVRIVFLSMSDPTAEQSRNQNSEQKSAAKKLAAPQLLRLRGADLKYSAIERKAWLHGGPGGVVTTETESGTITSDEVEMVLLQTGGTNLASASKRTAETLGRAEAPAQIDHVIARGHVILTSGDRRGIGEQVSYSGANSQYILTGTEAVPPRLIDPERGTVTGEALIFNSRDDSVSVEGVKHKTTTETHTPR